MPRMSMGSSYHSHQRHVLMTPEHLLTLLQNQLGHPKIHPVDPQCSYFVAGQVL